MKERLFIPTKFEIVYLLMASISTLLLISITPILKKSDPDSYHYIGENIGDLISKILTNFNGPKWVPIITVFLWILVGVLVYILLWVCVSLFNAYKSDAPVSRLIVPRGYKRSSNYFDLLGRLAIRTLAILALIVWIVLFFGATLPKTNTLFVDAFTDFKLSSVLDVASSVLLLMTGYFVIIVLIRLIYLRKRIFS